jgi:RNA polymerase sigma factor (TIGR02999 family)
MYSDPVFEKEQRVSKATAATGAEALVALFYEELKQIARRQRRGEPDTTNTTMLVHELYLQIVGRDELRFEKPVQFYAYAAQAMRHHLVDRARARGRIKAGGGGERVTLDESIVDDVQLLAAQAIELDSALTRLEQVDARAAKLVELHFFGGQSFERIAELLETSRRTVFRDWEFARAFLLRELRSDTAVP